MKEIESCTNSFNKKVPIGSNRRLCQFPGGNLLPLLIAVLVLAIVLPGCSNDEEDVWDSEKWNVTATVADDHILITATIADIHGDFIHMSIRREGRDNGYTVERSPAPDQLDRDWSRVHHWFGELHADTYLEGRIDDGSGEGPSKFRTYSFQLPRSLSLSRQDFPDMNGSDYKYITRGYSYADGNGRHPAFNVGNYEIEIYAWYTGTANFIHPAIDGYSGVQYIHYERPITSAKFVID